MVVLNLLTAAAHFGSDFNQQNLLALNSNLGGVTMLNANIPGLSSGLFLTPNIANVVPNNNVAASLHGKGHRPLFALPQFLLGHVQEQGGDSTWAEQLPSIETSTAKSQSSENDDQRNKNDEEVCSVVAEQRSDQVSSLR